MEQPQQQQPSVGPRQCPYTASTCPLFQPTFPPGEASDPGSPRTQSAPSVEAPSPIRPSATPAPELREDRSDLARSYPSPPFASTSSDRGSPYLCPSYPPPQPSPWYYSDYALAPPPPPHLPYQPPWGAPPPPQSTVGPSQSAYPPFVRRTSLGMAQSPMSGSSPGLFSILSGNPTGRSMAPSTSTPYPVPLPGGGPQPVPLVTTPPSVQTFLQRPNYSFERRRSGFEDTIEENGEQQDLAIPPGSEMAQRAMLAGAPLGRGMGYTYRPPGIGEGYGVVGDYRAYAPPGSYAGLVPSLNPPSLESPPSSKDTSPLLSPKPEGGFEGQQEDEDYVDEGDDGDADYVEEPRKRRRSGGERTSSIRPTPGPLTPTASRTYVAAGPSEGTATPFISKLHHLLSNPSYSDVIRWSSDGTCFLFAHTSPRLLDIFGRFFRHSNVGSFTRQLNIYGMERLQTVALLSVLEASPADPASGHEAPTSASDYSAFSHPGFWRDEPGKPSCDLSRIKPQGPKTAKGQANAAKKKAEGRTRRKKHKAPS
ncbi:hypothetical protein JCM1840_001967 [Sporobolomyces johnsonii]